MKNLLVACVLLVSLVSGFAAVAAEPVTEPTAEHALLSGANFVQRLRNDQRTTCKQPRSNTTEMCRGDYEAAIQRQVVFTTQFMIYLTAYHSHVGAKELKLLKASKDRALKELLDRTDILDRDYLPIKTTEAATQKK